MVPGGRRPPGSCSRSARPGRAASAFCLAPTFRQVCGASFSSRLAEKSRSSSMPRCSCLSSSLTSLSRSRVGSRWLSRPLGTRRPQEPEAPRARGRGTIRYWHRFSGRTGASALRCAERRTRVEIRTHETTLYNSLCRFDDVMLVNAHVWGVSAFAAPVLHLGRLGGGGLVD